MLEDNDDKSMNDKLKAVSNTSIEDAIVKSLSDLLGKSYQCNINQIDYSKTFSTTITLTLSEYSFTALSSTQSDK